MKKRVFRHIKSRVGGFTLVELMVTVAILAILLAIGVPSLQSFLLKQQVSADANTLASAFRLARSEALKRGGVVTVCPSLAPTATNPVCVTNNTTDWSTGWLIFIDYPDSSGNPGTYESDRDTILHVEQDIKSASITSSDSGKSVSFLSNGVSSSAAATYTIAPANDTLKKCVTVSKQGRSYVGDC